MNKLSLKKIRKTRKSAMLENLMSVRSRNRIVFIGLVNGYGFGFKDIVLGLIKFRKMVKF